MLAMHNWADSHAIDGQPARFPPPVIYGKDGTGDVPHSWRVELLPYMEQRALYDQYKFDEPWDSEANKRVLAMMPPTFRHPRDDPKSTNSGYFVLTPDLLRGEPGEGLPTAFSLKGGMPFMQIKDGTSNTLAVVEAKRDIPWTKPEDIPFDPDKDPPVLGGYFKDVAAVGLADGSVRFLDNKIDPSVLKLLIMPQDGKQIPPLP
jgi:hypothetical protein